MMPMAATMVMRMTLGKMFTGGGLQVGSIDTTEWHESVGRKDEGEVSWTRDDDYVDGGTKDDYDEDANEWQRKSCYIRYCS